VLVSEETIHQSSNCLRRELGRFRLKGKVQPIAVYELLCRLDESDERQRNGCAVFAEALASFRRKDWDAAIRKFNETNEIFGTDGPSSFYLELCRQYRESPPGEPWDGVIRMDKK
jgi:adenylate cyclase